MNSCTFRVGKKELFLSAQAATLKTNTSLLARKELATKTDGFAYKVSAILIVQRRYKI